MATVIVDIEHGRFPRVSVPAGTYVVWRNLDEAVHSAETGRKVAFYFTAGAMQRGELSTPVLFVRSGTFPYCCRYHPGMSGAVEVTDGGPIIVTPAGEADRRGDGSHDSHGPKGHHDASDVDPLKHLHGFVTGGRSGRKLYMSHTPVIADERHAYQVILRGSFADDSQVDAYEAFRRKHGDVLVQVFHKHMSMPDLASGATKELPHAWIRAYLAGPDRDESKIKGFTDDFRIIVDAVLHQHRFEPDRPYPDGLEYLVYGDADDVFIDHHITRAPNFHSVAKLASPPSFWDGRAAAMRVTVPSKRIVELQPRVLPRLAMVDNAFHVVWLPPPGLTQRPSDPLCNREGGAAIHPVVTSDGLAGTIEIAEAGFLWLDTGLLNYGVFIA